MHVFESNSVTWNDAGETKQVQGVKHLLNNGHGSRQEQRQQTSNTDKKQLMQQQGTEQGN